MDRIDKYNLFNSLISKRYLSKFPYSELNSDKLLFTKNKINLLIKTPSKHITGGYESLITLYY